MKILGDPVTGIAGSALFKNGENISCCDYYSYRVDSFINEKGLSRILRFQNRSADIFKAFFIKIIFYRKIISHKANWFYCFG
jgi:hypothetical protein